MTEVETELDSRYDDIDVDSILARCRRQGPLTFSRKRCIYQAPEFIKRLPSTEEVEEGSTVTFACKVVGFPAPTVTWYKDLAALTSESRAKTDTEDSGIHSIKIADVSKCDAGIYKIHASNLEGSSKSMLYISVKAKSKRRNKKKKRTGNVACAPFFPAIIEHVAEEQKEKLEIELQPESPLTPLYCTISRKAPVMWPAFLGDWAYHDDDMLQRGEIEDLGIECEDVFDSETEENITGDLTFVSTAYAQLNESNEAVSKDEQSGSAAENTDETNPKTEEIITKEEEQIRDCENTGETISNLCSEASLNYTELKDKTDTNDYVCDILNNNGKLDANNHDQNGWAVTKRTRDLNTTYQTVEKQVYSDPNTVSSISVHRSYARGDTTSSVARRSPSPFSRSRNQMTYSGLELDQETTTLQNLNNERILNRMNKDARIYHRCWYLFRSAATCSNWDDHFAKIILFICGSTFLALCFDLPPTTFIIDILVILIVKLVLSYVLNDN